MKKRGRWVLREIWNGGEDEEGREEFCVKMEMEGDGEMGCRVQEEGRAERVMVMPGVCACLWERWRARW